MATIKINHPKGGHSVIEETDLQKFLDMGYTEIKLTAKEKAAQEKAEKDAADAAALEEAEAAKKTEEEAAAKKTPV